MARQAPAPVWLHTRASLQLLIYLVTVHALAGLALFVAGLPALWQATGALALLASLGRYLMVHVWRRGPAAVASLHWRADGSWSVDDGRGREHRFPEHETILASPLLVLVRLFGAGRDRWLVLAGDSADAEALRQLRVRLRGACAESGDQAGPFTGR